MGNYRCRIIWSCGWSVWRGFISGIWYELGYERVVFVDGGGVLGSRYGGLKAVRVNDSRWLSDVASIVLGGESVFFDMGSEIDLRGMSEYSWRALESSDISSVLLWWGERAGLVDIRGWYCGHLGWFNGYKFEREYGSYLGEALGVWRGGSSWRRIRACIRGVERWRLKSVERDIMSGLERLLI
ncbi:MAG: hypothetical protein NZM04_00450 [Methylacidiphilales bacterium]|nr:hypothetical protein [Candidatus Methylacidiphilales bacterium]